MPKSFAPVRIQNPTSLQQIAKISPGQSIDLYINEDVFGSHVVDVSTESLFVTKVPCSGPEKLYKISHVNSVREWADYSTCLLGEIWIDGKNAIGKIGVMLECSNGEKSKIRTVVNPDCFDLRIYSYNIIELIVFDCRFGYHDEWNCEWRPVKDVGLNQIGQDHLCLHDSYGPYTGLEPANYLYARCPRGESTVGLLTRQHHFWFRFDYKIFKLIATESGIVHVGNIIVNGLSNKYQLQHADKVGSHMSLYVDFRKKWFPQTQETLNVKPKSEMQEPTSLVARQYDDYKPKWQPQPKIVLPEIRDVDISLIESPGEITGCKTLSATNESQSYRYNPWADWSDYEDDVDDYHFYHHHSNRHPHHKRWWSKFN